MKLLLHGLFACVFAQTLFAEIDAKQLEGYWKFSLKDEGFAISSISSYLPNGIFTDEGTVVMVIGGKEKKLTFEIIGKWQLLGDNLITTVSESSTPKLFPEGMVIKSKVTKITETQMSFISDLDKKEYTATRTSNPNPNQKKKK